MIDRIAQLHVGEIEAGRIDGQTHIAAARLESCDAAYGLNDAGKHQHTSRRRLTLGSTTDRNDAISFMKRFPR